MTLPAGDAWAYPLVFQCLPEPVGIVTPVGDQPFRCGQAAQQGRRAGVVADLARRHEVPKRAALGIGHGVQFELLPENRTVTEATI